jgi:putative ABC transport system ATP-binding protein
MSDPFIILQDVVISREKNEQFILNIRNLKIRRGEIVAILGPSGAGKTSLLSILAGLKKPHSGLVTVDGLDLYKMPSSALDSWRRYNVGIAFQMPHLVPELTASDNVILPHYFNHYTCDKKRKSDAKDLITSFGVDNDFLVGLLSRGEQQRIALARAIFGAPVILVADEPTASLDFSTGNLVARKLVEQARSLKSTLIVATHDTHLSAQCDQVIFMKNGQISRAP